MKKKITRIWGIGLVVILATSLLLSAAPVSAKELAWGTEGIHTGGRHAWLFQIGFALTDYSPLSLDNYTYTYIYVLVILSVPK